MPQWLTGERQWLVGSEILAITLGARSDTLKAMSCAPIKSFSRPLPTIRTSQRPQSACSHTILKTGTSSPYTCTCVCMKKCTLIDLYRSTMVHTDHTNIKCCMWITVQVYSSVTCAHRHKTVGVLFECNVCEHSWLVLDKHPFSPQNDWGVIKSPLRSCPKCQW